MMTRRMQAKEHINIINIDGDTLRIGNRFTYFPILDGDPGGGGRTGWAMPTFLINSLPLWIDGGSIIQSVRTMDRNLTLPVNLAKCDHVAMDDMIRALKSHLNPLRGDVTIQHVREDGNTRELTCRYSGGLEQLQDYGNHSFLPIEFLATDPFWRELPELDVTFAGLTPPAFLCFELCFELCPDNIWDSVALNNHGDTVTYPYFELRGPGLVWELINNTTGKNFKISYPLLVGEVMSINFDPRRLTKLAIDGMGNDLFSFIDINKMDAWPLEIGINDLTFIITGTTGNTRVSMYYYERYF
jgi:hypothetical protein